MSTVEFIDLALAELSVLRHCSNPQGKPEADVALAWAETLRTYRKRVPKFFLDPGLIAETRQAFNRAAWEQILTEQPMLLRRQAL